MALIKKTANDANLIINEASWNEVNELKKSILEELKELDFDLNKIEGMNLAESTESIILFLLNTDTSPRFEMALFDCLKHCTYDNISITPQLFDDLPQARGDYYEIVKECVVVNLRPFMKSLSLQFPILNLFMELYQNILSKPISDFT